jgi:hypothetical protein
VSGLTRISLNVNACTTSRLVWMPRGALRMPWRYRRYRGDAAQAEREQRQEDCRHRGERSPEMQDAEPMVQCRPVTLGNQERGQKLQRSDSLVITEMHAIDGLRPGPEA